MTDPQIPQEIHQSAASLLENAGHGRLISITPFTGGRNNRVYRVASASAAGILKHYQQNPTASHDRFATETVWYEYCQQQRLAWVPEFWGSDPVTRCVLLADVAGRRLDIGEVSSGDVQQAIEFFRDLNAGRESSLAAKIPLAAEARFSFSTMLQVIENRIARLRTLPVTDDVAEATAEWVQLVLDPLWEQISADAQAGLTPAEFDKPWSIHARRLSPSDFGFHNALLTSEGRLVFVDFEYAGWDDPSKLICDFYWQVDRPVPRSTMPSFVTAISAGSKEIKQRVGRLFPAFGIKWCSIVLNDFLHDGHARRQFALGQAEDRRPVQLQKAKMLLADVEEQIGSANSED